MSRRKKSEKFGWIESNCEKYEQMLHSSAGFEASGRLGRGGLGIVFTFSAFFLFTAPIFAQTEIKMVPLNTTKGKPSKVPGEFILSVGEEGSPRTIDRIVKKYDLTLARKYYHNAFVVVRKNNADIPDEEIIARVGRDPEVSYIEPQGIAYACADINDYWYASQNKQEHLRRIGMQEVWSMSSGFQPGSPDVTVAMVDTGILMSHEDWKSGTFAAGIDMVNNDNDPSDDHQHGTHTAGTVAEWTNNQVGCGSVAFGVKLMPVKVLGSGASGYASTIASGIRWAADNGAQVINASLGQTGESATYCNAVDYAWNKGAVVVAAAGNDGTSSPFYPAACNNAIAVSATNFSDGLASYSNWGDWINMTAPGGDMNDMDASFQPRAVLQCSFEMNQPGKPGYFFMHGTSMAAPHIAGVAAIMLSCNPSLTNAEVREILESTAEDLGTAGPDVKFGVGLVDAAAAYAEACAGADGDSDGDSDSDTDGDSDGDTDTDTGTEEDGDDDDDNDDDDTGGGDPEGDDDDNDDNDNDDDDNDGEADDDDDDNDDNNDDDNDDDNSIMDDGHKDGACDCASTGVRESSRSSAGLLNMLLALIVD